MMFKYVRSTFLIISWVRNTSIFFRIAKKNLEKEDTDKAQFFKGLAIVLPQYSNKILEQKVKNRGAIYFDLKILCLGVTCSTFVYANE